jgi:phospholipid/cholesterol/gamma-HCH transport system substrate-binding protein
MSEKNVIMRVGLFVLAGLIVLVGSILLFSGSENALAKKYQLKAKFTSTQGLANGSVVSLAGVTIGNIVDIQFDDQLNLIATLNILEKFKNRITDKSLASIRTQGALGDKYIYITPSSENGKILEENEILATDTKPDFLDSLTQKATDISIVETVNELNLLLQSLNAKDRLPVLLESLTNTSKNITQLSNDSNLTESFVHLRSVLKKLDKGEGTLGLLINDSALHDRLMAILGETPRNKYLKPLIRDAIKQNEKENRSTNP